MLKPQYSLMRNGFAVVMDKDMNRWEVVAVFEGWIDAHNYLIRNIGENRGKVVKVKELQGEMEEEKDGKRE